MICGINGGRDHPSLIYDARCATYVNLIHDGLELTVLAVEGTNGGHGRVEVLHVLGVHLEEGCIPHHDVSDPLELCTFAPLGHPGLELGKREVECGLLVIGEIYWTTWVIMGEIYLMVTRSNRATVKRGNKGRLSRISYTGGRSSCWQRK